MSMHTITPEMQ